MSGSSLNIPCGKHVNISKDTKKWVRKLKKINGIKKIIWGLSWNSRHSKKPGTPKFKKITETGLHYLIYTENGVRDIFIITNQNKEKMKNSINKVT